MKSLASIVAKEWSEHRWLLFIQCGFCLLCFAFIYYKIKSADLLSQGSFSLAFICWPIFAVIVASSLSFRLYTLESKDRTSCFLAGLPIPRWHIMAGKVGFSWFALTLVCLAYFACVAMVSPQANLDSWNSIVYPLVRLFSFNWFAVTLLFLVSMLGKYRWHFYLVCIATFLYLRQSGAANQSFFEIIPAIRLVEEERALGDLSSLPWSLIAKTVGIGCIALGAILLADRIIQKLQLESRLTRVPNISDRIVTALVILGIPALFVTVTFNNTAARIDLEYYLAFEVDHEARSDSTLVELSYYKERPEDELEIQLDQEMIGDVASLLESARERLDPSWWPEHWLLVKSPDVKVDAESWAKRVSGDAVIFVANWNRKEGEAKGAEYLLAGSQLAHLIDSMLISGRHRDQHGWALSGLAKFLIPSVSGKLPPKKEDVDALAEHSIDLWPGVVNNSKNLQAFSSGLLGEVETQLGEEEFDAWIREVGILGLTKPRANTLFDLKRSGVYWRGLIRDSTASLRKRGFDPDAALKSLQSRVTDDE